VKGRRAQTWALGLVFLLIGTAGAFALGRLAAKTMLVPDRLSGSVPGPAPDLVGRPLARAREEAEDVAGGLDVLGVAYSSDVDSGDVLAQYPPEGMPVERGKPIEVVVSAGSGRRRVPELSGLTEESARDLLAAVGIPLAGVRAVVDGGFEKGTVVSTEPSAGSPLSEKDSVTLAVSRGGAIVEVPNLAGRSQSEAADLLQGTQLRPGEVTFEKGEDEDVGEPVVVGQDPPAGGLAESGTAVDLRMGRAPR
jgi:beta-lactam-binding protein with PASTA domain